jgi:hypothetical protein
MSDQVSDLTAEVLRLRAWIEEYGATAGYGTDQCGECWNDARDGKEPHRPECSVPSLLRGRMGE